MMITMMMIIKKIMTMRSIDDYNKDNDKNL